MGGEEEATLRSAELNKWNWEDDRRLAGFVILPSLLLRSHSEEMSDVRTMWTLASQSLGRLSSSLSAATACNEGRTPRRVTTFSNCQ